MRYFIDSSKGNDVNDGLTQKSAFASLAKIKDITFTEDTSLCLRCGSIWNQPLIIDKKFGECCVLITSYGDGPFPIIDGNGAENTVLLSNVSNVTVENLEIVNVHTDTSNEHRGVYIYSDKPGTQKNINIRNLYVHDIVTKISRTAGGIICWADPAESPVNFDGVTVEDCRITDCMAQGITFTSAHSYRIGIDWTDIPYSASENIVIKNNYISRCAGDGIFQSCGNSAVIKNNTVADCCYAGNTPYAGIWPHNSQGTVMANNEAFGNRLIAGDGQGYDVDIDCTDTVVTDNYSHHNDGGFILLCTSGDIGGYNNNIDVKRNISYEDSGQIFTLSGPIKNINLSDNTVIAEKVKDTRFIGMYQWGDSGGGPDNVTVKNNYIYMNSNGKNMFYPDSKYEFTGNNFYGKYDFSDITDKNKKSFIRKFEFINRSYGLVPHLSFKNKNLELLNQEEKIDETK